MLCALLPGCGLLAADRRALPAPFRRPTRCRRLGVVTPGLRPPPPRRPRRVVAGLASVAGRDASSRMACIAAAYPAAKASRRTSSICCCNSLTVVLAFAGHPPYRNAK
jgi:hypothetical protein